MANLFSLVGGRGGLAAVAGLMLFTLGGGRATALDADQMADLLHRRNWFEDIASGGGQVWGRVYVFNTGRGATRSGWKAGYIVTYKGRLGGVHAVPMDWKATANGVQIDNGLSVETVRFVAVSGQLEVLTGARGNQRVTWSSTRSPLTPATVRVSYYR